MRDREHNKRLLRRASSVKLSADEHSVRRMAVQRRRASLDDGSDGMWSIIVMVPSAPLPFPPRPVPPPSVHHVDGNGPKTLMLCF